MAPLGEALRSAPKFEAQEARAHGFGMRALEEFKDSQVWLKVDSTGTYDLGLAANEYMENGGKDNAYTALLMVGGLLLAAGEGVDHGTGVSPGGRANPSCAGGERLNRRT